MLKLVAAENIPQKFVKQVKESISIVGHLLKRLCVGKNIIHSRIVWEGIPFLTHTVREGIMIFTRSVSILSIHVGGGLFERYGKFHRRNYSFLMLASLRMCSKVEMQVTWNKIPEE